MFEDPRLAPSILSGDFMNMQQSIDHIVEGGADFIHVDVMDGHFVPNISMGIPLVKQLHALDVLPLDVHLMVSNPLRQIPWFLEAGADYLSFHTEALDNDEEKIFEAIHMIRDAGARPGLAIKPDTEISIIKKFIHELDLVLVMSVYPGFSGQSYIEGSELRVAEVAEIAKKAQVNPLIEVDGGIDVHTVPLVASYGADVFVAGNAVFGTDDPRIAIESIKKAARCHEQAR